MLVPDEATYVEELSRWSPRGRWPVLFEDDLLAPMFIRRFEPAHVLRREPGAGGSGATSVTRQQLEAAVVRAWGGDPQNQTWREAFDQHGYTPPGVVITTVRDPAWTAGVALAAGRGQPDLLSRISTAVNDALRREIQRLLSDQTDATGAAAAIEKVAAAERSRGAAAP